MIDIEQILQTEIPDIAAVYGGVRGRTISSKHQADKGIVPPIRGYRKEDGHDTNKIMRVLNAFYQLKVEIDDKEPMPIEVFKERKKVINEKSKI